MNLNTLEKIARQVLSGNANTTATNVHLTSAEKRALASQTWQVIPGGVAAGTFAKAQPMGAWG